MVRPRAARRRGAARRTRRRRPRTRPPRPRWCRCRSRRGSRCGAWSAVMPCASSTWLGSLSPLAQALPAATAKPARSSDSTSRSERMPSASSSEWPGRRSTSADTGVRPPPDPLFEPVAERAAAVAAAAHRRQRGREPDHAGHVLGAASRARLLAAAPDQRPQPRGVARDQRADALRAVHLVRRQRHRLGARIREVHRQRRRRLHRVGVQRHAPLGADRRQLGDRLHDAGDVVRPHHRRHPVTRSHRPVERVQVDHAERIDPHPGHLEALPLQLPGRLPARRDARSRSPRSAPAGGR